MNTSFRKLSAKGFTLIELLIVVIIIAILAAIAIPQFSNTTADAQESALDANLNNLRSAIEMFKVQHNGTLPGVSASGGGNTSDCTTANGTQSSGAANSAAALKEQLTMFTDITGHTCSVAAPGFMYGPYLRDQLPIEPISNPPSNAVVMINTTGTPTAPAAATGGWRYNYATGRIDMNSNANDRRGNGYWTH
jgi:general secretion pathway protein G